MTFVDLTPEKRKPTMGRWALLLRIPALPEMASMILRRGRMRLKILHHTVADKTI
jgi:hypothetical protein